MLKKMRWRFIGAAMAAFGAVIFTLLCFINIWNYKSTTDQQDATLERLLEVDKQDLPVPAGQITPPFESMDRFSGEVPYMIRFFSVHLSSSGDVVRVNQNYIASVSEEDGSNYALSVLEKGKERGYTSGYRFLLSQNEDETTILFLNSERELQMLKTLLWITVCIAILILLVVFGLVALFSGRVIRPYIKNIEAQKQFITNASHELKTPLTAISTSADVLSMEYENNEWVENIQMQTARLSKLIGNLVTLSRLNEENPFPLKSVFSLSEALWEIGEPFNTVAHAKGKRYVQDLEDGLNMIGERNSVQQTVSILLDNAFKYSCENGVVTLDAHRDGKHISVCVTNTVAPDLKLDTSRLFDRFYRADQSHSVGGNGIGLAIARATVEAHGGIIDAKQEGNCVLFRITFYNVSK